MSDPGQTIGLYILGVFVIALIGVAGAAWFFLVSNY